MLGGSLIGLLALLALLGAFVIYVMVLIKQFKDAGPVHGIIGILCGLWTFIWGWMNATRLNIRNLMLIWTALIILYFVLGALGGGFALMQGTAPGNIPGLVLP